MPLRITTWNVNGIRTPRSLKNFHRNPFSYQPWRDKRTFAAMFDILEADIVVFQETKIQRKDLRDDMVLVPGWDCYWSLPRHKKGYSGVVIYTRQAVCSPIRAEEGITGVLCPPNSSTSFSELPEDSQIGGYPTSTQVAEFGNSVVDFPTLDSEGRCVILEFPAFVLIGVYSPANRDEMRDDFRIGFLNVLDARVRNLVAMGKRVFLTGDLNISKEVLDTANAEGAMRRSGMTEVEYFSTSSRRLFNQLLEYSTIYGERDEGREKPVMWDICRGFHPTRKGMFTCWEQKVNARPGNFGARIDYVLCSLDMKGWFVDSNIQEGLLGSDHCPVYATLKDTITLNGKEFDVKDVMNAEGVFRDGKRIREHSVKDILPLSGKLIPEFDRRQNIRDMFTRKPILPREQSTIPETSPTKTEQSIVSLQSTTKSGSPINSFSSGSTLSPTRTVTTLPSPEVANSSNSAVNASTRSTATKRSLPEKSTGRSLKRVKSGSTTSPTIASGKGQQSLKGFFKPKATTSNENLDIQATATIEGSDIQIATESAVGFDERSVLSQASSQPSEPQVPSGVCTPPRDKTNGFRAHESVESSPASSRQKGVADQEDVHDPIESKESWSKLFAKPIAPRCEGHGEPCITLVTKKSGMNCGRSFWMCSRPLGPTGAKEKNTQWRCQTFIWCSDWNAGDM